MNYAHLTHPLVAQGAFVLFILFEIAIILCHKPGPHVPVGIMHNHDTLKIKQHKYAHTLITTISWGLLFTILFFALYAHTNVDVRYLHVLSHNHSEQPWYFRIASLWSHHETSLLVWLFILNLSGRVISYPSNKFIADSNNGVQIYQPAHAMQRTLLACINCLIATYMFFEANPFDATPIQALNTTAQGMNPLLYDLNMVWHPPLLYVSTTLLFAPYCWGLYATFAQPLRAAFAIGAQRYITCIFSLLTLAIALGSFWAFTQLGWGGYWFWDPVETASLLPWIGCLCVLHTPVARLIKRPALLCLPFIGVILSFFAVRSGLLRSVHSFAQDSISLYVFGILAFILCLPLIFIAISWHTKQQAIDEATNDPQDQQSPSQKDTTSLDWLHVSLIGFYSLLLICTLGVFIPAFVQLDLSARFFNTLLQPIAMAAMITLLTMTLSNCPNITLYAWRHFKLDTINWRAFNSAMTCAIIYVYSTSEFSWTILACNLCIGSMVPLIKRKPTMAIAHIGIAFVIIGCILDQHSSNEVITTLKKNQPIATNGYTLVYRGMQTSESKFKTDQLTTIDIYTDAHYAFTQKHTAHGLYAYPPTQLRPAKQFFHFSQLQRPKADWKLLSTQIVMITQYEEKDANQISVHLYIKEGMLCLALGVILIVLGSMLRFFQNPFNMNLSTRFIKNLTADHNKEK